MANIPANTCANTTLIPDLPVTYLLKYLRIPANTNLIILLPTHILPQKVCIVHIIRYIM